MIERGDYPGRLTTPVIVDLPTPLVQYEELLERSRTAQARELAYRKTLRGRIDSWIWNKRYKLSRMICSYED